MKTGGILVTYSVKGSVRRILKNVGFDVEKLPGPPGKREITRAMKK
jgi:tRNA U34 5-methylaminomethyl-2-thiouridine-forming methyltransferase MnmC